MSPAVPHHVRRADPGGGRGTPHRLLGGGAAPAAHGEHLAAHRR